MNNFEKVLLVGSVIVIGKYIYDSGYDKGYSQCDLDITTGKRFNLDNKNRPPHTEKKKLWDLGNYQMTITKKEKV